MTLSLAGKNVAILVANGFDEHQMTEIQRALTKAKATIRTIAPEQGVVNGWQGDAWGHYFPVDAQINEALGSDFDMLVLPGGERSTSKLKSNLHTKRIVGHFIDAGKPIAAIEMGVSLLALTGKIAGRVVATSSNVVEDVINAGAEASDEVQEIDGNILSANGEDLAAWVNEAIEFFGDADLVKQAA